MSWPLALQIGPNVFGPVEFSVVLEIILSFKDICIMYCYVYKSINMLPPIMDATGNPRSPIPWPGFLDTFSIPHSPGNEKGAVLKNGIVKGIVNYVLCII